MSNTATDTSISLEALADHWGLTVRRLRDLARDGVAVSDGRGEFLLRESDRRYIAKLRSHDEARRLKAKLLERQTQRQEVRLHREARELVTRAEARGEFSEWWGITWESAAAAIARHFHALPGDDRERRLLCHALYRDLMGELRLARDRIANVRLAPETLPSLLDIELERLGVATNTDDDEE